MNKKLFILVTLVFLIPMTSIISNNNSTLLMAADPVVDGLFYGEPSGSGSSDFALGSYNFIGSAPDGSGTYYAKLNSNMLFLAVVVDAKVNDNVFGLKPSDVDDAYLISAGWTQGASSAKEHTMQKLISSDNMHMKITTDCGIWEWDLGYLHVNSNPIIDVPTDINPDPMGDWIWFCGTDDPDGSMGNLPTGVLVNQATSAQWNMINTNWDVTLGGTRAVSGGSQLSKIGLEWKSPFVDPDNILVGVGYPTWDPTNLWEWQLVYEMQLDLTDCNPSSVVVAINPAHNSPGKEFENVIIEDIYDWGDLPDGNDPTGAPFIHQYPTLLASNGPRHLLYPGGPYLGSIVDSDLDGMPTEQADGDDLDDGSDDHDGVQFISLDPDGTGDATFEVIAGTDGYLNAWIDWNGDSDFDDTNERIKTEDYFLTAGTHTLIVPTIAEPAEILYHRWRFTAAEEQAILPTGEAPNGEVEDYMSTETPLPVELSSFIAEATNQGVWCNWTTESEIENLGFILERKTQGTNWLEIASYKTDNSLLGQGTISSYTNYEYLDAMVQVGSTYEYRLADVDYNGVVTYHSIRTVTVEQTPITSAIEEFTLLPAYPNPFNPSTNIEYAIPKDGMVNVTIYDLMGKKVSSLVSTEQKAGWHNVNWYGNDENGTQVPAGVYLLSINTGNSLKTMKLLFIK